MSEMQFVRFRQTAMQVADDFLAQQNITLGKGKKRKTTPTDV